MTEEQVKEYLDRALVTGKADASNLADSILRRMDSHIESSVKRHVNGQITGIKKQIEDYIVSDNEWKEEYQPYIKGLANLSGGAKILVWICVGISSVAGAFIIIKNLLFK